MCSEILSPSQIELLDLMSEFKREYYLVGGTAIALYVGHRRSVDFDLFKKAEINHEKNLEKIRKSGKKYIITRHVAPQMNLVVEGVKVTFFQYSYDIKAKQKYKNYFRLPTLLDLAAMKAFAMGRRSKWKDYVDLYFLLKNHFTFRAQLSYFSDIDYTEEVEWLIPNPPTNMEIQEELAKISVSDFV